MAASRFREKILHWAFRIGILFKGIDGLVETIGGFLFLSVSGDAMTDFIFRVTRPELLEDPDDWIANTLRHTFNHLSTSGKIFVGAYLLGHGMIKLFLVVGLWREKRWIFPAACVILIAFIGYQIYRLCHHFSPGLLMVTLLDGVIIALVWHEYRWLLKKNR